MTTTNTEIAYEVVGVNDRVLGIADSSLAARWESRAAGEDFVPAQTTGAPVWSSLKTAPVDGAFRAFVYLRQA